MDGREYWTVDNETVVASIMKNYGLILLAVLGLGFGVGCGTMKKTGPQFDARAQQPKLGGLTNLTSISPTNGVLSEWLRPDTNLFTLGPGDRVEIEVFGDPTSRTITTIGPDGKIYYYLLPGIDVWGMTLGQTKVALEQALTNYVKTSPIVGVTLRGIESKRVWLLGRLQNAGVYPMTAPVTLLEAISMAGGPLASSASGTTEDLADLQHSFLVRRGQMLPINFDRLLKQGDIGQNIYLQPDDFVYLPSSLSRDIYVLGAVRAPKVVGYINQGTLVAAIAAAGGPIKDAYLSHVAVVRGSLSKPEVAIVDYQEIVKGRAPDVRLEPRDIVYIPFSPYRYLNKYVDLIMSTFVRAVAINEGSRAASKSAAPAGVAIGVGPAPAVVR